MLLAVSHSNRDVAVSHSNRDVSAASWKMLPQQLADHEVARLALSGAVRMVMMYSLVTLMIMYSLFSWVLSLVSVSVRVSG
jgi:hypothetical protein